MASQLEVVPVTVIAPESAYNKIQANIYGNDEERQRYSVCTQKTPEEYG